MANRSEEGLRAVGYVRVSTEDQAREGFSLSAQERAISDWCKAKRWNLVKVYKDEGISAYRNVERPAFNSLMKDIGAWDVCVVWKLNRLHRTMRGFIQTALTLEEKGKDLASVTESIDTSSAIGKFVYHILGAISELESGQTSERVKFAFAEKFESDTAWFTRPPLGYRLVDHKLQVVLEEAAIVKALFEKAPTMIVKELVRWAHQNGIHGKGFKDGRRTRTLSSVTILNVLHNPVYVGYVFHNGELRLNKHEAIVSVEDYNRVSRVLAQRNRKNKRPPMILGAKRIKADRIITSGGGQAVYVPK